jgi:hypothetical protein
MSCRGHKNSQFFGAVSKQSGGSHGKFTQAVKQQKIGNNSDSMSQMIIFTFHGVKAEASQAEGKTRWRVAAMNKTKEGREAFAQSTKD